MPKPTLVAEPTPLRVVIVTLDSHLVGAVDRASRELGKEIPGLTLSLHVAAEWHDDPEALERCRADIERGDIIVATMLFMEEHIEPILPWLQKRRDECDAMVGCMSAGEVVRLTRLGRFSIDGDQGRILSRLKNFRGWKRDKKGAKQSEGARQLAMLRRIPRILRFIPGPAQDLRVFFLTMQYWLSGSEHNVANLVRLLTERYAQGPRRVLREAVEAESPVEYPEVGAYHPRLRGRIAEKRDALPRVNDAAGTVGLLVMRSYVLASNTGHYDGVIEALEERGLNVVPVFASGLDNRPAVEQFFLDNGRPVVDAVVSLTGFSLVGGPAYNDAAAAQELLGRLDVPYLAAHAVEFQSLEQWQESDRGLSPIEATMMVSIPELDGSTGPMVYGGRSRDTETVREQEMRAHPERAAMLAARVSRLVALRNTPRAERRVGVVLFNFPPNAGNTGTAMYLSVFESLYRTLQSMREQGYTVEVPDSVDALRERIITGNSARFGAAANVYARISADDHVRREQWLGEIEGQWGPAPGKQQSDGGSIFIQGECFGNVFVGVQPGFGYEDDPMRLLFEKGFAPTHAFSAFYRFLREDFGAHSLLHFGTHGALEFMPGKQVGLTGQCWPDRLIGDMPNFYLYAANNPSEGAIAKRRSAATLISYLTPPIASAGLYRGLIDLKASLERWRGLEPDAEAERGELAGVIQAQAAELDLADAEPQWQDAAHERIGALGEAVREMEQTLIPCGLHVVGEGVAPDDRVEMLLVAAEALHASASSRPAMEALVSGAGPQEALAAAGLAAEAGLGEAFDQLHRINRLLAEDHEIPALLEALDGRFVQPAPGGDLVRAPEILPTGRNLHGFDPFRIPSRFAVASGAGQAARLLDKHRDAGNALPETIAMVLWGTDNLKTEGGAIAQALALMGARPRFDSYGRLAGAALIPLQELDRPRIDVVMTLSGIFRDLLPLQTRMLAEACYLAASADEAAADNFVRKHALAYQSEHDCDLETAALRVFSNADGAYGANVNQLVQNGLWEDEEELGDTYTQRKCFAYSRQGKPVRQKELLQSVLSGVELAYQNLDSVELGVTTVDVYFDNLGGISRAINSAGAGDGDGGVPVYIGDQTRGDGTVRTLDEQVALETRTRVLNPKWYEGMLEHGYEGVRQIEVHVTNTMGWSATTGQVAPWVYQQLTQTYMLDEELRERMAALNPTASAQVANRLLEAHERQYWTPDADMLDALKRAGEELEDRLEGINIGAAA